MTNKKVMKAYGGAVKVDRDKLVEDNVRLVKIIAYQVAVNLPPHIDVSDLISAGTIGLLECIDRFDPSKGVQFNTYASIRIRGAIMDELRSMDWMTRSMRDKSNQIQKAYEVIERETGKTAEVEDVARHMKIDVPQVNKILSEVCSLSILSFEDMGVKHNSDGMDILECIKDPDGEDPVMVAKLNELKKRVSEVIETLPEKEKIIISLYYYDELTLKEIGKVLDITESRICQLHSQTMHRLKSRLKRFMGS